MGKKWKQCQTLFFGAPKSLQMVTAATELKDLLAPWKKSYDKPRQCIKKQRDHFAGKGPYNQSYGFSSSHVCMWELNHKEGWEPKTDAFELWFRRRLLRVLWTARRSNQSLLKEMNPEYSWKDWFWSWSSNTLATWCEKLTH